MWDKVKEYFTAIFAQGVWLGKKGKSVIEWIEKNKTGLFTILGIIVVVFVVLVYVDTTGE